VSQVIEENDTFWW